VGQLGVRDGPWSEQVARQAVWVYGHTSGAVAVEALRRLAGIVLSEASLWRGVQRWGQPLQTYEQLRQTSGNALPWRGEAGVTARRSAQNMGVAMDGTMVHVRQEGWKELKVGCVFDVEVRPDRLPESEEVEDRAHAIHSSYAGVLGSAAGFGRMLWAEAVRRGVPQAHDSIVIGDGAHWIGDLAQEHFGSSVK
jgi:hypothetical protein